MFLHGFYQPLNKRIIQKWSQAWEGYELKHAKQKQQLKLIIV